MTKEIDISILEHKFFARMSVRWSSFFSFTHRGLRFARNSLSHFTDPFGVLHTTATCFSLRSVVAATEMSPIAVDVIVFVIYRSVRSTHWNALHSLTCLLALYGVGRY